MGGGARCSRRHSPRSSKIVVAESRANVSAISTNGLAISATAARFDAIAADALLGLRGCEQEAKLPFHRARQETAHAVLLPVSRLHHFCDAGSLRPAQQCEHALLLGDLLALWSFRLNRCFVGGLLGLRDN